MVVVEREVDHEFVSERLEGPAQLFEIEPVGQRQPRPGLEHGFAREGSAHAFAFEFGDVDVLGGEDVRYVADDAGSVEADQFESQ